MSTPAWLPPLNSHDQNHIIVQISQTLDADHMESVKRPMFLMKFRAYVDFISDNKDTTQRSFRGLSVLDYFHVPCDYITSKLSKSFMEAILYNLSSFGFDGDITWVEKHLSDVEAAIPCELSEEDGDVFDKIEEFLSGMVEKEYNIGKNLLMFDLEVRKKIVIPDEELVSWNSWYDEKKRNDPHFEFEFRLAISKPRTEEELMNENAVISRGIFKSSIIDQLAVVKVDESLPQRFCLICLEEFLLESQVIKLPCGHIFGENCIRKWLQQNTTCPFCIFTFQITI